MIVWLAEFAVFYFCSVAELVVFWFLCLVWCLLVSIFVLALWLFAGIWCFVVVFAVGCLLRFVV